MSYPGYILTSSSPFVLTLTDLTQKDLYNFTTYLEDTYFWTQAQKKKKKKKDCVLLE